MSEKQPEALRLADILDKVGGQFPVEAKAAKELRRLHEVNAGLLDALRAMIEVFKNVPEEISFSYDEPLEPKTQWDYEAFQALGFANSTIAKATKDQE